MGNQNGRATQNTHGRTVNTDLAPCPSIPCLTSPNLCTQGCEGDDGGAEQHGEPLPTHGARLRGQDGGRACLQGGREAGQGDQSWRYRETSGEQLCKRVLAVVANDRQGESSPVPVPCPHRLVAEG